MTRSRVTFATMEAAAIDRLIVSPLTTVSTGHSSKGSRFPSTRARDKVSEFVPALVDTVDDSVVGAVKIAGQLKVVRRIGENHIDG